MNLVHFNDPSTAKKLLDGIHAHARKLDQVTIMEVCGTHTMEIGRLGLRPLLPENVELVSGPGCPVCVTPGTVIDRAAELALEHDVTVCTFGDMMRVPGNKTSLENARRRGAAIEVVTSPLQVLQLAESNPSEEYVFIAVGFETTIPVVARTVVIASEKRLSNISFIICHRLVPPALDVLIDDKDIALSGFLLPGHVSAIIGMQAYAGLTGAKIPGVVTGFEPLDIIGGIQAVMTLLTEHRYEVVNRYPRIVKPEGNPHALQLMSEVFSPADAVFRGIGPIPNSGLALQEQFGSYDACRKYKIDIQEDIMPKGCSCGAVLKGIIRPDQCPLFAGACTPNSPVGPCMVSSEGSCAAYYRYER
ncbi:MAG: hydrogenase formation protein HypD [Chitinivibrionales bacterium]|nr:hydrogenase formation protein HypD [Chitinivibrionales bacterium]